MPEGKFVGQKIKLRDWQKAEIYRIYDNENITRRAILSFARKNAKTTLAAMLLLVHLCGPEARRNSQLFSAAQSRDQAAVLFALAAKMVRMSPELNAHITIRDSAKQLYCGEIGTLYRALSAEASTAYGLSPVFVVHDELGQVKGPMSDLYEALETASGAHDNPLSIIISTQAPTDAALLSVLIDDAMNDNDKKVVVSLYSAPDDIDPFSEAALKAANPAYGDFLDADQLLDKAEAARRMPSAEPSYRNLHLNQRVEAHSPLLSRALWQDCAATAPAPDFSGVPVYAGLDLSETTDLTALVMVARIGDKLHVKPVFWLPEEGLAERSKKDRVPYTTWKKQGFLQTTPGKTIGYDFVASYMRDVFDATDMQAVAFDRWNFRHFKRDLVLAGFGEAQLGVFKEFGQGFRSMSPALRELESAALGGRLIHYDNPVMTMCAANAVAQTDPAGNRKLAKNKSSGRIDGMVALAMAVSAACEHQQDEQTKSYLEAGGLLVL